tara:strand:+ start:460 stop:567 length:108 start_codon:yes stop_codon:yes gene_type:complete
MSKSGMDIARQSKSQLIERIGELQQRIHELEKLAE